MDDDEHMKSQEKNRASVSSHGLVAAGVGLRGAVRDSVSWEMGYRANDHISSD